MISEFSVRPVPKNKNARTLFFVLLGAAFASVALSYFAPFYKGVIQLASLILLVGAVMIYTRYIGAYYCYEVAFDSSSAPIFLVTQTSGKRKTALCRIELADVVAIQMLSAEQYRAYKPKAGIKRYHYTPTLRPAEVYLMQVRSHNEQADIFVEISEPCCQTLLSFAAEARAARSIEGED